MNPLSSGLIGFHFSCFSSRHTQAQSPARAAMMNALEEWYDYEQAVIKALAMPEYLVEISAIAVLD